MKTEYLTMNSPLHTLFFFILKFEICIFLLSGEVTELTCWPFLILFNCCFFFSVNILQIVKLDFV